MNLFSKLLGRYIYKRLDKKGRKYYILFFLVILLVFLPSTLLPTSHEDSTKNNPLYSMISNRIGPATQPNYWNMRYIANGIKKYYAEEGKIPKVIQKRSFIDRKKIYYPDQISSNAIDLCTSLTPKYISKIEQTDKVVTNCANYETNYTIQQNMNRTITILDFEKHPFYKKILPNDSDLPSRTGIPFTFDPKDPTLFIME